jgi:hypothetical protein
MKIVFDFSALEFHIFATKLTFLRQVENSIKMGVFDIFSSEFT